jgi:uncharacterized protein (DUF1499 family)
MNKLIFRALIIGLIFLGINSSAQNGERIRERISNAKLNEIGKRMGLNKSVMYELRPTYLKYEREKAAINIKSLNVQWMSEMPEDSLTDEQAEKLYFLVMDRTRKTLDLQEKYYSEFKKILTPKQIMRLYRTEIEINRRMMQSVRKRLNHRM